MITIPEKLKQRGIYFVLIRARDKKPFQFAWQNRRIEYDDPELLNHLADGGNYGVMGGGPKNLILVDFDDASVQEKALQILPDTFTVRTGSGMLHLYYYTDNHPESFKGFSADMNTLFDAQAEGKQVVGPGSIHPNGNKYEILHNHDIGFIEYEKLKKLLSSHDQRPKKEVQETKKFIKVGPQLGDDTFLDTLKEKIPPQRVLDEICKIPIDVNPTACPFHESKGGHCLGFDDMTAHCFHCDGAWNSFTLIKDFNKCTFKEALEVMVKMAGLEVQYEENKKKFQDAMKAYQAKFKDDEKKKDDELAVNRQGPYVAGRSTVDAKEELVYTQTYNDANGNPIDPLGDDAVRKLMKKHNPPKRPAIQEERKKSPDIGLAKEDKNRGRIKFEDGEKPYG